MKTFDSKLSLFGVWLQTSVVGDLAPKKWSLNKGGLLIEVKLHGKATIGT